MGYHAFAFLIRSNRDISFIPSNVKALALVCYNDNNNAANEDCSEYELGGSWERLII